AAHPTSAVINVSSPAALQPVPYMAVYAATKAFMHSFSQALYGEWKSRGITVQTLVPGPTATEFDSLSGPYESRLHERDSPIGVESADTSPGSWAIATWEGLAATRGVLPGRSIDSGSARGA